jgi:hypothetical protein
VTLLLPPQRHDSRPEHGFPGLVEDLETVDLDALTGVAELQDRHDAKFLVPDDVVAKLLPRLAPPMRVLEVDGRRASSYHSVYFDTPAFDCYRAHLQGRRRRFKVRTRHYGDPAAAMLEVKTKGLRGRTVKQRVPHPAAAPDVLDDEARRYVAQVLASAYGMEPPEVLVPAASTSYERITLVDLDAGERVTIDLGLQIRVGDHQRDLLTRHAIVECKTRGLRSPTTRAFVELGLRPRSLSKFCLAVASTRRDLPGNPWRPVLREAGAL